MTASTLIDGLIPPVRTDTASIRSILAERFPGAVIWFGRFTRRWWALVWAGGRWRLVEGAQPEDLTRAIINAQR
jgi:hypothetical protein